MLVNLQCEKCYKLFATKEWFVKNNINRGRGIPRYCSRACSDLALVKSKNIVCSFCNKNFTKLLSQIKRTQNHFCSCSCAAKYNNTHKTKGTRVSKLEVWLKSQLAEKFPNLEFHFNRKDAINSELDIFIPSIKLAFELNGIFHYEPIYGIEKLSQIQNNDQRKFQACLEQEIELCIIDTSSFGYFKEQKANQYLDIIISVIDNKLGSTRT